MKSKAELPFEDLIMMRPDRAEDDAELIARIVAGNLAALGVLYDRYQDDVRRFVLRSTMRTADADDIVQEAFLAVQRAGASYDGRPCARPFLIGIAAQIARARFRKRARFLRMLGSLKETVTRAVMRTPEDAASEAREIETVSRALLRMSEEKRTVLLMIEREGLSGEEVAAALDIPVATVWTRLHYARAEVRRALARKRST
ncbi:putative RNA polymerase ECF-subfamily sigma factor [Minicystis rosea]|nr:putative RNA polymerase ECF-subfamily sigma factor [Minicystis rosea]